jgi:hypothetical protein
VAVGGGAQGVRALKDQQTASAIRIQTIERRRQGRKAYFEKISKPKVVTKKTKTVKTMVTHNGKNQKKTTFPT